MTFELDLSRGRRFGETSSERSRELGARLHDAISAYRHVHPELSEGEVDAALDGLHTRGARLPTPVDEPVELPAARFKAVSAAVAFMIVFAMLAALVFIRRP